MKHLVQYLVLVSLFLAIGIITTRPSPLDGDSLGYYAYSRSLLFDGDLLFKNEFEHYGPAHIRYLCYTTPRGMLGNVFPFGSTVLWYPFLVIGHLAQNVLVGAADLPGFGRLEIFSVQSGTAVLGASALFFSFLLLSRRLKRSSFWTAAIAVTLLTPFAWYTWRQPLWPHVNTAFTSALFLWYWTKTRGGRTISQSFLLGIILGFSCTVRPEQIILLIFPFVEYVLERYSFNPGNLAASITGILIGFAPQLVVWFLLGDDPLTIFPSEQHLIPPDETSVFFFRPAILQTLFSSYHGILPWSPLYFISIIGLLYFLREDLVFGLSSLLVVGGAIYINALLYDWWAGLSFGPRRLVDITPVFLVGTAYWVDRTKRSWSSAILFLLGTWSALLYLQSFLFTDLNFYLSFQDILRGQLEAARNLVTFLQKALLPFRPAEGNFPAALLILLAVSISGILICRWRFTAPIVSAQVIILVGVVLISLWISGTSRRLDYDSLLKYSNKNHYSKARFLYAPTYLENVTYYAGTGQYDKAQRELKKAVRFYQGNHPELINIFKHYPALAKRGEQ